MSISNIIADYLFKEGVASEALRLEDEADTFIAAIGPLAIPPIASPFGRREQQTFPLYKRAATTPDQQGVVGGFEEPESESYDTVTIEDLPENLTSLFGITGREGKVDVFGRSYQIGPEPVKGTFGVTQTFNPGYALGQFASLASPVSASFVGEKNREQLEYIQAMAGLGKQGYGIGLVNGQVVGVTPSHIVGTVPNASPEDMEKIRNTLTGKSGPMKAGVEAFKNIRPETPVTSPMRKFQDEVIKATGIPDSLKSQILGFDYDRSKFQNIMAFRGETRSPDEIKKNLGYRDLITGKDFLKDYRDARDLGAGDDRDDQIDEQTFIDTTATPKGPDTYFSDMPTGGFFTDSDDSYDSGTGDPTGGFGGSSEGDFGFTAYGGKIGMSNGGFASKTATVKGVGLIKPEQTFVDTDVVDDDIEFPAENGDYIINGPASNEKEKEIKLLVNYGIDELKKEGVDIRVGNPKIKGENKVPLIVASSETYIPRVIAEKIGYPILDALNNTGKPEVARLKRKLNDEPSDESKYEASSGGFLFSDKRRGTMLFNQPVMDVTSPNIDRAYDAFVPGISDVPIPMKPDDEMFFGYTLGRIKDALYQKEMKGYEGKGYIFTGVKPKGKKASSAFGKFQITYSTLEDFKDRSDDYANLSKEEKTYVDNLIQQGRDKVNLDLQYGLRRKGKIIPMKSVSKKLRQQLSGLQQGTIPQEIHKKHYDKIADLVIRQKLKDHKNKGLNKFLASYGEGQQYADDVEKILKKLGKKNLIKN